MVTLSGLKIAFRDIPVLFQYFCSRSEAAFKWARFSAVAKQFYVVPESLSPSFTLYRQPSLGG